MGKNFCKLVEFRGESLNTRHVLLCMPVQLHKYGYYMYIHVHVCLYVNASLYMYFSIVSKCYGHLFAQGFMTNSVLRMSPITVAILTPTHSYTRSTRT